MNINAIQNAIKGLPQTKEPTSQLFTIGNSEHDTQGIGIKFLVTEADKKPFEGLPVLDFSYKFKQPLADLIIFRDAVQNGEPLAFNEGENLLLMRYIMTDGTEVGFKYLTKDIAALEAFIEAKAKELNLPEYEVINNEGLAKDSDVESFKNSMFTMPSIEGVSSDDIGMVRGGTEAFNERLEGNEDMQKQLDAEMEYQAKVAKLNTQSFINENYGSEVYRVQGKDAIRFYYEGKPLKTVRLEVRYNTPNTLDFYPLRYAIAAAIYKNTKDNILDNGAYSNGLGFDFEVESFDIANTKKLLKKTLKKLRISNYTLTDKVFYKDEV